MRKPARHRRSSSIIKFPTPSPAPEETPKEIAARGQPIAHPFLVSEVRRPDGSRVDPLRWAEYGLASIPEAAPARLTGLFVFRKLRRIAHEEWQRIRHALGLAAPNIVERISRETYPRSPERR